MSNYEFWDELGKIFNAVVAYQEKAVEFNKRFINPWIRLGNVFDKQDRNDEAVDAYQKAIEIDPKNAQNWYEVGNIHFRMGKFEEAVNAFTQAIELDPGFGWPYNNLALTYVSQGKFADAIPLYRQSIELLEEDKDKAVAWNRLGNVYRKLNEYEQAVEAFQKADELDQENAGFRDNLDEQPEGPTLVEANTEDNDAPAVPVTLSLRELIPAETLTADAVSEDQEQISSEIAASAETDSIPVEASVEPVEMVDDAQPAVAAQVEETQLAVDEVSQVSGTDAEIPEQTNTENVAAESQSATLEAVDETAVTSEVEQEVPEIVSKIPLEPIAEAVVASTYDVSPADEPQTVTSSVTEEANAGEETVTVVVQSSVETYTETLTVTETSSNTSEAPLNLEVAEETADVSLSQNVEPVLENADQPSEPVSAVSDTLPVEKTTTVGAPAAEEANVETPAITIQVEAEERIIEVNASVVEEIAAVDAFADLETNLDEQTTEHPAYDEYLKDSSDPIHIYEAGAGEDIAEIGDAAASQEPLAKINSTGDLQIEMDTKNAHVWNELGNVYFNTGAFDDAVIAYSKAIELDRWFAWPYSNLALTYVQKGRFVEAILLYQRSIELFTSEKDKAISWNRLGNVYRRINDYENAIAAYQRADELDPDNTTLSLQSRFSLLGSYVVEQKPSYVS